MEKKLITITQKHMPQELTSSEYQQKCMRTDLSPEQYQSAGARAAKCVHLLHGTLGLMTEIGEIADTLKKCIIYGQTLDIQNIEEECGDVDWYLSKVADSIGAARSALQEANIEKLSIRYPEKFTEELAKERLDKKISNATCLMCGSHTHNINQCPEKDKFESV